MATQAVDVTLADRTVARRRSRPRELELWVPAGVLVVVVGWCFFGPLLVHVPGPEAGVLTQGMLPPLSTGHLLGTTALGNDIFSRCLYGGRVSVEVGLGAVAIGMAVGGMLGVFAGYKGGWSDSVIMRCLDVLLAFPSLVLALAVAAYLGPNERDVILAIAFFTVPAFARLARADALSLRERDFISAAKLVGQKDRRIIFGHVIPNVLPNLLTFALLMTAVAMVIEAALDYLGLGIPPPSPSWGDMIATGQSQLSTAPWIALEPAAFLLVTVLCLNLVGDALRAWRQIA